MAQNLPYLDSSLAVEVRIDDLLQRMNLEEKAGQLFHHMILMGPDGSLAEASSQIGLDSTDTVVRTKLMSHFNLVGHIKDAKVVAEWHNRLQQYVLDNTRLGIPVTLSTDPRNHFTDNIGTSFNAGILSQWPETLGFAALRSAELVERFADIVRQEYIALGLRAALHPQVDLATEYRWARINTTFGEDADLAGDLGAAYVRGLQTKQIGKDSVSAMTKHFPGGGPQKDGEDPHFDYGKEQVYPGGQFEYHVKPFWKTIEAGTRQIMPYYGKPEGLELNGQKVEEVAFAFNKGMITDLLRNKMGFKDGIVCTDWGLITDTSIHGQKMSARAWGAEDLSELQRLVKILEAGCDQFGGEARPELVIEAVEKGLVDEKRVDVSVRRLLREKFLLGLFDDKRFVDADRAAEVVGKEAWVKEGQQAQARSHTLLKNDRDALPLNKAGGRKVYLEGIKPEAVAEKGWNVVENYKDADVALLRFKAPFEPRTGGFESFFHAGSLEWPDEERKRQAEIYQTVPVTVVDVYLDRPAVLTEIAGKATALLVSYGSSTEAFLDIVDGSTKPEGKLPFDMPRSMRAVEESKEDMPYGTKDPLFRFGDGLSYK